jgi:hypothetical protein
MISGIIIAMAEVNQVEVGISSGQADEAQREGSRTVSLSELARFIANQDDDITAHVVALGEEAPTVLAEPAEITQHAGRIGLEAGRRAVLNALSQEFFQDVPSGPIVPAQERLAS